MFFLCEKITKTVFLQPWVAEKSNGNWLCKVTVFAIISFNKEGIKRIRRTVL